MPLGGSAGCAPGATDERGSAPFDTEALREWLRQQPSAAAPDQPWPSHWTLRTIREPVPALAGYSLSGVWRLLRREGTSWRRGSVQQFSPGPEYAATRNHLLICLTETVVDSGRVKLLFFDEMGFIRWP